MERARAIYKYALDHIPKAQAENLYARFVAFEKQHGDREGIEEVVISKRRWGQGCRAGAGCGVCAVALGDGQQRAEVDAGQWPAKPMGTGQRVGLGREGKRCWGDDACIRVAVSICRCHVARVPGFSIVSCRCSVLLVAALIMSSVVFSTLLHTSPLSPLP